MYAGEVLSRDEGAGLAALFGPTRAADAVRVGIGCVRDVVVDHVADSRHVDSPCRDVGGNEDVVATLAEALHGPLALSLAHVALQGDGVHACPLEIPGQTPGAMLGAQEDDGRGEVLLVQQVCQKICLAALLHWVERVLDGLHGRRDGQLDHVRVVQQVVGQAADLARHGGGEQQVLTPLGQLLDDALDVGQETHVEHVVGLVENQDLQPVEAHVLAAHQVEQSPGAGDDDVGSAAQGALLGHGADAAKDRDGADVGELAQHLEVAVDLHGQLARGREDQGPRVLSAAGHKALDDGQREGGGLARAGLGQAEHVAAFEHLGNGLGLDGPGLAEARLGYGAQNVFVQPEGRKCVLRPGGSFTCHVD